MRNSQSKTSKSKKKTKKQKKINYKDLKITFEQELGITLEAIRLQNNFPRSFLSKVGFWSLLPIQGFPSGCTVSCFFFDKNQRQRQLKIFSKHGTWRYTKNTKKRKIGKIVASQYSWFPDGWKIRKQQDRTKSIKTTDSHRQLDVLIQKNIIKLFY